MNTQQQQSQTRHTIHLNVNGTDYALAIGEAVGTVAPSDTLAHTLRETLGLTGTKISCDQGSCGACTVIMNGKPILSCMTLTVECDGARVETIEGLEDADSGELHPLQQSFVDNSAFQCGFCTPGILMSTKSLIDQDPHPTRDSIKQALSGHFCRCISHYEVIDAVCEATAKGGDHE
ncbi:(2Fe-2S)-binding protein [Desulfosarcina ovata]|uniref:Ferredoxin n=1 Tax=Desulfosarcina ovata subsp. ovata TaxID=2752305 RepID=A0A5K8AID5_9BACT|nr:(2Fe-2S)-binding protein [Desulfosarcina ovata]BBO92249.1 ferredoxin [Desulfosarcina ovata subsp. ovata]